MSSYLVLARKYRPKNFTELVGQDVLVKTISNAIKNDRLHHAYILNGIRGVGKTTTARIIAKTINCLDPNSKIKASPCEICDSCKLINNSSHQDVIEIDGASKTKIDDVREIIDSIAYAPVISKYKIYIIDEFHMMSKSAFNALLKTIEEPPMDVKFIFATTEIREVPITILSRCQRFDLRRLNHQEIISHLNNILKKENIEVEQQALALIADCSDGSVRDSLSILDQALANNNHEPFMSVELVEKMLGLNDTNQIINLVELIFQGELEKAIESFRIIYDYTSDVKSLIEQILKVVHKICLLKTNIDHKFNDLTITQIDKIKEFSQKLKVDYLLRVWNLLVKTKSEISYNLDPKIAFEILLIKTCHIISIPDLKKILIDLKSQNNNDLSSEIKVSDQNQINSNITNNNDQDSIINQILNSFPQSRIIT